jgi:PhzF family phenazine biosynthesis protein
VNTAASRFEFRQVDVFSADPCFGNPVAVVLGADGLSGEQMQAIARWTNLSETTFVLQPTQSQADYRLRIFCPDKELPFAGHPTLGSARAWLDAGGSPRGPALVQECARGLVPVHRDHKDPQRLFLQLPEARQEDIDTPSRTELQDALGALTQTEPRIVDVGPRWLIAQLESTGKVRALTPSMAGIAKLSRRIAISGVTVFGRDGGKTEVRSFAPAAGIDEDPVCGSGNGAVAAFLQHNGQSGDYVADQGICRGRRGRVFVRYEPENVIWIGGDTRVCIAGTFAL